MDQTAPPTPEPTQPDPKQDRPGASMPACIAAVLHVVRVLLGHGHYLKEAVPARAATRPFPTLAAVCGTHNVAVILARVQRGILHAIALERYLLARAARGRALAFVEPRIRTPANPPEVDQPASPDQPAPPDQPVSPEAEQPARPKARPRRWPDPDDLADFEIPTLEELEAQVRRRPIGRTILLICQDLGVVPGFCTGELWNDIFNVMRSYGGSFTTLYKVRAHREKTFQKERDRRPETWDWNWRSLRQETIRQVLGCLVGEAPPTPPIPLLATAPP